MSMISSNLMFMENSISWIITAILLSYTISYFMIPVIIKVSNLKKLADAPGKRCVHVAEVPNLGGVGIFLSIVVVTTFLGSYFLDKNLLVLLGALTILFFTGLKDDLIELSPISKLLGQLISILSVILIADFRIDNLHGLMGICQLSYSVSVLLTLFVFLLVINSYNLIDGVDGLAGGIGLISSLIFGLFFVKANIPMMVFLSFAIVGSLVAFLSFNLSKKMKIFMGDTGSMIIGFLLAYQCVSFVNVNIAESILFGVNGPLIALSIISFPLLDTVRVIIVRLKKKQNVFAGDQNHLHHSLLRLGLKHWQISLIGSSFGLLMLLLIYKFNMIETNTLLLIMCMKSLFFVLSINMIKKILVTAKKLKLRMP
ncbi:MAG: undecaprenyl/decaprenyl-phosphate alpha-N-acetylglucosaminyl 1-phosphate transferase [Flavobacteriaceae bacterium]|nr:undecaprenyl/decaprenyl-phosphate alpha-N-acetylglucosaminyl 1-phosphate transferase [Flavobacteriaceae bacterium]